MWKKYAKYLSYMILLIQFVFLIWANFFCVRTTIDNDVCKLFVHTIKMWEHKNIFVPDWSNMTTLELDCSSLFALPIYGICRNIYVSFALANVILAVIFCLLIYSIVKRMGGSDTAAAIGCAVFITPLSFGQLMYYNMTFFAGGQYVVKALVPLLAIWVISSETDRIFDLSVNKKNKILWMVAALFLIFLGLITGLSSSLYVFGIALAPIIGTYLWLIWCRHKSVAAAFKDVKIWVLGFTSLTSGIGAVIARRAGIADDANSFAIVGVEDAIPSAVKFFKGLLEYFGAYPQSEVELFSIDGIMYFTKIIIVILAAAAVIRTAREIFGKFGLIESRSELIKAFLVILILWEAFMQIIHGSGHNDRYFTPAIAPVFILTVTAWESSIGRLANETANVHSNLNGGSSFRYIATAFCAMLLALVMCVISDKQVADNKCTPEMAGYVDKFEHLLDFIKERDEKVIVCYNDSGMAETMRLLDYGSDRHYLSADEMGNIQVYGYYNSESDYFNEDGDYLIIFENERNDISLLPQNLTEGTEYAGGYQIYDVYAK